MVIKMIQVITRTMIMLVIAMVTVTTRMKAMRRRLTHNTPLVLTLRTPFVVVARRVVEAVKGALDSGEGLTLLFRVVTSDILDSDKKEGRSDKALLENKAQLIDALFDLKALKMIRQSKKCEYLQKSHHSVS
jgi:hypothetical protein